MGNEYIFVFYIFIILLVGCGIGIIVKLINNTNNYYPNKTFHINLSKKQRIDNSDLIDFYIINYGTKEIMAHLQAIRDWKKEKVTSYKENEKKIKKFEERCKKNKHKAFTFIGFRSQTRYRQINYQRHSYQAEIISNNVDCSESFIMDRILFLHSLDYEVTYNSYNKTDQRKLLTQELRNKIKERDNYTCQICGKEMLDEVGLHIDHIVPISKGGKTLEKNLRVLCSKCNGKKGNR